MSPTSQDIAARLLEYDGRSPATLLGIRADYAERAGFLDGLIDSVDAQPEQVSAGATWLIKDALEEGRQLDVDQTDRLLCKAMNSVGWAAQLHLCQSLRHFEIPEAHAEPLAEWLTQLVKHKRPFVRAWALDGLAHLAKQHDGYKARFEMTLAEALEDDAASVRARARNLCGPG